MCPPFPGIACERTTARHAGRIGKRYGWVSTLAGQAALKLKREHSPDLPRTGKAVLRLPRNQRQINSLSMEMTHTRRKKNGHKERKRVLREMKAVVTVVRAHAQRYHRLLDENWQATELDPSAG